MLRFMTRLTISQVMWSKFTFESTPNILLCNRILSLCALDI